MQNPFTTTFSKIPDYTYIPTEQSQEIIENFSYDNPSESVYKITGVRGSGKTVLLGKVEEEFLSEEKQKQGWKVYRLSAGRDILGQLASKLYKDGFSKKKNRIKSVSLSATVLGTGGGLGVSETGKEEFFDIGAELDEMLACAKEKGGKILLGIDEVLKNEAMIIFASEFVKWLRAGYPVYLVCTGLYENMEQLSNVKNLTFFRRATTVKTEPLNFIRMSEMYKNCLSIDAKKAQYLATITKGYAYAFQELGVLSFKRKKNENMDSVIGSLKTELFSYSYEKIWEELAEGDKELVRALAGKDEYKRAEVIATMNSPQNYSVYRDRLRQRGIVTTRQGYISLALPFFGEYVEEYCGRA